MPERTAGDERDRGPRDQQPGQPEPQHALMPHHGCSAALVEVDRRGRSEAGGDDRRCDHESDTAMVKAALRASPASAPRKPALARQARLTRSTRASARRRIPRSSQDRDRSQRIDVGRARNGRCPCTSGDRGCPPREGRPAPRGSASAASQALHTRQAAYTAPNRAIGATVEPHPQASRCAGTSRPEASPSAASCGIKTYRIGVSLAFRYASGAYGASSASGAGQLLRRRA